MKKRGYLYIPKKEKVSRVKATKKPADESNRIVASPELDKLPDKGPSEFQEGQSVELIISDRPNWVIRRLSTTPARACFIKMRCFRP